MILVAVLGFLAGIGVGWRIGGGPAGPVSYLPQVGTAAPTDSELGGRR